jgi:A/G-specific adenine glycosylase
MMRTPQSNQTIEGALDAVRWLEENPEMPLQLRRILTNYYQQNGRDFPWRGTRDPYKVLVAETLLQKTSVKPVTDIWSAFIRQYPDVEMLASSSLHHIEALIRPLGLQKRAKVLLESARCIVRTAGSQIPGNAQFLKSLPGVGDYTAAAILSFAFNINAAAIDVNAARVYTRICGFSPNTLRQGLAFARAVGERVVSPETHREVNYGLLDLAAQLCGKSKPNCSQCPAREICQYARITSADQKYSASPAPRVE